MLKNKSVLFMAFALVASLTGYSAKADTICYGVYDCIPACYTDENGDEVCETVCGYRFICSEEDEDGGGNDGGTDPCFGNYTKKGLCNLNN